MKGLSNKHAPSTSILLHRDRDYLNDEEVEEFKKKNEKAGMRCLLTEGTDIESYYLSPERIHQLYPEISIKHARQMIVESMHETQDKSIEKFINLRIQNVNNKRRKDKEVKQPNPGRISKEANEEYQQNPKRYCHGKSVLANLKVKIQKESGNNPNLFKPTKFLKDRYLESEAKNI